MILTVKEKNIIKLSFARLIKNNVSFAECFYDNLFEMAPLIKPLFKSDRKTLENHLNELISITVNNIDQFEELHSTLFELGKKHNEYGTEIAHFKIVKAAFILSIQYNFKEQCDETLVIAWSKYVDNICQVMIEGLTTES